MTSIPLFRFSWWDSCFPTGGVRSMTSGQPCWTLVRAGEQTTQQFIAFVWLSSSPSLLFPLPCTLSCQEGRQNCQNVEPSFDLPSNLLSAAISKRIHGGFLEEVGKWHYFSLMGWGGQTCMHLFLYCSHLKTSVQHWDSKPSLLYFFWLRERQRASSWGFDGVFLVRWCTYNLSPPSPSQSTK